MEELPKGWMRTCRSQRRDGGQDKLLLEKNELTKSWPDEAQEVKEALMEWMTENEITTVVEEG